MEGTAAPSIPNYGGQAVIEGVMMRSRRAMAVAVRHPAGHTVIHVEPLRLGTPAEPLGTAAAHPWHGAAMGYIGARHAGAGVLRERGRSGGARP